MFWDARVIRLHPFRVRDDKVARGLLSILTRMWQGRHGQEAEAAPGQLDQALLESERANAIPNEGLDLTESCARWRSQKRPGTAAATSTPAWGART
jgi:hypothetical protein